MHNLGNSPRKSYILSMEVYSNYGIYLYTKIIYVKNQTSPFECTSTGTIYFAYKTLPAILFVYWLLFTQFPVQILFTINNVITYLLWVWYIIINVGVCQTHKRVFILVLFCDGKRKTSRVQALLIWTF